MAGIQLRLCWSETVCSSSGYRSMSAVTALSGHAKGTGPSGQWRVARRMITDTARVAAAATYALMAARLSSRCPTNMEARTIQAGVWSRSFSLFGVRAVVGINWCLLPAWPRLAAAEVCAERD